MILLTGATGTIGQATVNALRTLGQPFRVATRSAARMKAQGIDTVPFDWDDLDSYVPAMRGIEKLFLLTPNIERQVGYVTQAVAAAKRAGVRHIVRLSVAGADADPGIILGRLHHAAEREIRASGIAWTMLRPTFFMQNFVSYYGVDPKADSQVHLPNGQGKAAWIDAADVGQVAAAVLARPGFEGRAFDLTGPEALSTPEVLAVFTQEWKHNYVYNEVPVDTARQSMEGAGLPLWLVDGFLELNALIREGHAATLADGVEQVLGRKPRALREWAVNLAAS